MACCMRLSSAAGRWRGQACAAAFVPCLQKSSKVLADAMEALLGAFLVAGGYPAALALLQASAGRRGRRLRLPRAAAPGWGLCSQPYSQVPAACTVAGP